MAKNGLRTFDSDMHVFEPADLYQNYMNPKWGKRVPIGKPRTKHGMTRYFINDGEPIRSPSEVVSFHENRMAERFNDSLARDYDNVSQLAAMDKEGLDIAVLFRTSPLHTNESFEPDYANDLCKAWNDWMVDFCKADSKRLKASALITLHDVDLAVGEAKRAAKNGAVGLSLCPEPINGRQIHDSYFDPLWSPAGAAAAAAGVQGPLRGTPESGPAGQSAAQSHRADSRRQRFYRRRRAGALSRAQGRLPRRQLRLVALAALSPR